MSFVLENTYETTENWSSITSSSDGVNLAAVAYISIGGDIYTSSDSGNTWNAREIIDLSNESWTSITSDSTGVNLAACIDGDYIYTSTDSGVTWVQRASEEVWTSITSDSTGANLAACVNGGLIYTSNDYGINWSSNNNSSGNKNWKSITSDSSGLKLAACDYGGYIYTSTDYGVTWSNNDNSSDTKFWTSVTSDSTGANLAACVDDGYIYTSTNYGVIWDPRQPTGGFTQEWYSITSDASGVNLAACVNGGYIYTSNDSGVSWIEEVSLGAKNWYSITSSSDGCKLAACVYNEYIYTFKKNVTDVTCECGSLINNFLNGDTLVEKFTTIPGNLNTKMLENGDYSDQSIIIIFEHLKKYAYNESIFDKIKYSLAASFPSLAYEQEYVKIINEELTPLFVNGKITQHEYDKALEITAKELADKYPTWYFNNLSKIEEAIIKYKYILTPFPPL